MVAEDDGLKTRPVGAWSEEKLHFWHRYIEITTRAMVGNPKWNGIYYVDLFAGPGVCVLDSGHRIPGSALIAANAVKPFNGIFACEWKSDLASALESRLQRSPAATRAGVFVGDCNQQVQAIASCIPNGALTLAFIDPEALDVQFGTVEALARRGAVDLLILFPDDMDIVRNVEEYYEKNPGSKLDKFLGISTWRTDWSKVLNRSRDNICDFFSGLYMEQLKTRLGYTVFRRKPMDNSTGRSIYSLIYASKDETGLKFWDSALAKDVHGQREFEW